MSVSLAAKAPKMRSQARILLGALCAALLLLPSSCGRKPDRALNLYIWSAYLAPNTLPDFEKRFNVRVRYDLYESNEALLAKLKSGSVGYDIIVPSDYMVEILIREKLLAPLDKSRLPNLSNIDPRFLNRHYDPENLYSVPYAWGTTGIAYRKDKIEEAIDSWAALWDEKYRNRIAMLDDMRENFAAALKLKGFSLNSTDPVQIRQAKELLLEQKRLVRAYISSGIPEILLSGDVWIAQVYSGQAAKAATENPNIAYVIPKEGCTLAIDNMCIPLDAPHKELAHDFINYILEPQVSADLCHHTRYSTPNRAALALLKPEVLQNPAIFPPDYLLSRCEMIRDLGPAIKLYDQYWTEIKSR